MLRRSLIVAVAAAALPASWAAAERPTAMRLFPSRSVVFVRTPEGAELNRKLTSSPLLSDPEVTPFLASLYSRIDESFRKGPGKVTGGGIGDLLQLFQGEVALAVVPRRNEEPGVIFLADTVSQLDPDTQALGPQRASDLVEAISQYAEQQGDTEVADEAIGATTVRVFRPANDTSKAWGVAQRDGVLLASSDRVLLESALLKWDAADGVPTPIAAAEPAAAEDEATEDEDQQKRIARLRRRYAEPLSNNAAFTESLRECVEERIGGGDTKPPQLAAFVDSIGIFRAASEGNVGMRFALATLPVLGLDGIEGVAAAMWIDVGDWDSLIRAHLLLDTPRAGVLKIARLRPTDPTPADAIPADVASYACGAVDFAAILDGAEQLHDKIRGEGKFAELVEAEFKKETGFTMKELAPLLEGRVAMIQAYGDTAEGEAPRVFPARAVLLRITDAERVDRVVRAMLEKSPTTPEWREHAGVDYACTDPKGQQLGSTEEGANSPRRQANDGPPFVAMLGEDLVICQTESLLKKLIETHQGDRPRLAEHLPYRLTASRAGRLGAGSVGGDEGRLLLYEDPGEQFRQWHAAGESDASREQLERMAQFAPPMRWLRDTLEETGAPPLEALLRHAVPSGSAVYDTPTGYRYVQFTFKVDDEP